MKSFRLLSAVFVVLAVASTHTHAQQSISLRPQLKGPGALVKWSLDGSGAWTIAEGKLILERAGKPAGPIRRPGALAVFKMLLRNPSRQQQDLQFLVVETPQL